MKRQRLIWFAVCAIGVAVMVGLIAVPPRGYSWQNESILPNSGGLFGSLFPPSEINILLLGRPGDTYNGGGLTDSLLVAHINPDKNSVYLISIPRDLWVTNDNEQFKINEGLHKNKMDVVLATAEDMTGFDLDGYVVIDLSWTQKVIDALGGVDITLKESATDWVSGYTMAPGAHHLNGEDAIWLIRNRYNPEGDFFREGNQQMILSAVIQKFKTLSLDKKLSFIKTYVVDAGLLDQVHVSVTRLMSYALEAEKLSSLKIKSIVLDFSTKLFISSSVPVQGPTSTLYSSVLVPAEGFGKYDTIRNYIKLKTEN